MKKLFAALRRELGEGRGAVLCSVVASHGSTPRGAGAKMLVLENGQTLGTVGGGAVEYRAGQLAAELLEGAFPEAYAWLLEYAAGLGDPEVTEAIEDLWT